MSATNDTGGSGKPLTVRVAAWSARHRWPVFVLWFVFTIGLFATSVAMGGTKTSPGRPGPAAVRTKSGIAETTFNASGGGTPREEFVLVISCATRFRPRIRPSARLSRTSWPRSAARRMPPAQPCSPSSSIPTVFPPRPASSCRRRVRPDCPTVYGDAAAVTPKLDAVRPVLDAARTGHADYAIHALSTTLMTADLNEIILSDLDGSLKLTLPLTFLILLLAFGAIVAARVPLRPRPLLASGRLRNPRDLQPARGPRRRQRQPARAARRPRRRGRLFAVHHHPLPLRSAASVATSTRRSKSPAAPPVARCSSPALPSPSPSPACSPSASTC